LAIFARYGPEYRGGLSNHGPMGAEALVTMGRPDVVMPWVERYRNFLQKPPSAGNPIVAGEWREALGEPRRVGDWTEFFERELAGAPWQEVLGTWLDRLAPGLVGAAAHCLIRVGHVVRQLELAETPERLGELARGLGYWAARFTLLPGKPAGGGESGPAGAIEAVELLPRSLRNGGRLITDQMMALKEFPPFTGVINKADPARGAPDFLSELTRVFAEVYLQNTDKMIGFVHALTGPSALRLLAPYVKPASRPAASLYAWQAAAGIYATMAAKRFVPTPENAARTDSSVDDLVDRAVTNGDTHVIKFTEACLREWKVNPDPAYLAAARDLTERRRAFF
jgi:hypothetical protein